MSTSEPGRIDVAFSGWLGTFSLNARFSVPATGVTAVFGPSGCGKTTVARCIAGLHHLADGFCAIDGDVWQDSVNFRPPHLRPIGYVFQEASLFPHLTVKRNLHYGAPKHTPPSIPFEEVVELLGLGRLIDRSPGHLSGGERQRVAIGRALLSQPKLLLMDEPLAALDRSAKNEILPFLERLHEKLSLPIIYISHDMAEIERFADHLVMMERGDVRDAGALHAVQSNPALPLAASREAAVSLDGTVGGYDGRYGLLILRVKGGRLLVPAPPTELGARQRLRIAASDVSIARKPLDCSILNILPARIVSQSPLGTGEVTIVLALGADGTGAKLLARITRRSWDVLSLSEGMDVFAQVKGVSLVSASDRRADGILRANTAREIRINTSHQPPPRHGDCSRQQARLRNGARITPMSLDFAEIDPNRLAAILYRPEDDVDALLAEFAYDLQRKGERVGGIVQRNLKDAAGRKIGMQAIDLLTGREISICQSLGNGAMACKLHSGGLAEAAVAVARAISDDARLVVINKFSKQEASGGGLRGEFAEAVIAGIPLLTAVPEKCFDAWKTFTGDVGTTLLCERQVVEGWWRDLSSRMARMRENFATPVRPTPICQSSRPTT